MTDKKLGSAVPGETTKSFGAATGQWDTPAGQLDLLADHLSKFKASPPMPPSQISAGPAQIEKEAGSLEWGAKIFAHVPGFKDLSGKMSNLSTQLREGEKQVEGMIPYLDDQGRMTKGGYARYLADISNKDPKIGAIKPDPALVKQTSDMLAKQGIQDDPQHSVANGLAKSAVFGSNLTKYLETDLEKNVSTASAVLGAKPASAPKV